MFEDYLDFGSNNDSGSYDYMPDDGYSRNIEPVSYIRVFHASPDAPAVDVYANGGLIARNISYRGFTQYMRVRPGNYLITVFPAGQTVNPVIRVNLTIAVNTIYTVAAIGRLSALRLLPILEPKLAIPPGSLYIRFGHLSPNAPDVDLTLRDGTALFRNVRFGQVTDYVAVRPGNYTFELRVSATGQRVLYVPNIVLRPNRFLTIYAVGIAGGMPPLQVLIPMDGNTYLRF